MLLADVPYIPELFLAYQQEELSTKNRFIRSGILSTNEAIQSEFSKGGRTIDLPFFGDLSGDDELLSDVTGLTPVGIDGDVQIGVRLMRGKAWKSSDLAAELAGSDPMQAIARRTGFYWQTRLQTAALKILDGLFDAAGPLNGSHTFGGNSTATDAGAFIDAIAKLGDSGNQVTGIAMHSAVYYKLTKADLSVGGAFGSAASQIDTRVSAENPEFEAFLRRNVIVDDSLPFTVGTGTGSTNTYTSYLFAPGALAYANAPAKVPYEVERDKFKGIDYMINRTHYMVHPNGLSWVGTASGSGPSNAELATAANWDKVYSDNKNIRMIALRSYA
jgi:hypothetical protein